MLLPALGRTTHALGMPGEQGERVPVEGMYGRGLYH